MQDNRKKGPRILFLITGLRLGGAEIQCLLLVQNLIKMGFTVMVVSMEPGGQMVPKFLECGAEVKELGIKSISSMLTGLGKFSRIVRQFKPDVVHSHMIHANFLARISRLFTPIKKLICTAHSITEGTKSIMSIYRYTNFLADYNTNVSREATDEYVAKGYFKKNTAKFIPNAIDTAAFVYDPYSRDTVRNELGLTTEAYVYLAVGRLHEAKDYPNLLNAFARLCQEDTNERHLLIIGEGTLRSDIEQKIETLGIATHITLLGLQTEVSQYMSAADCFVLSSAYEGFGLVVAEALSCELPVVATDAGGVKEVLSKHGVLVPIKDSLRLSRAMLEVEKRHHYRVPEGRGHVVAHYDIRTIIKQWINLYGLQTDGI